jgi:hypothetical protein
VAWRAKRFKIFMIEVRAAILAFDYMIDVEATILVAALNAFVTIALANGSRDFFPFR